MKHSVEIENVVKTFGTLTAVDDLSLHVPEGSIYGFIGPNGSGKTTTIRMIMNILYPDSGTIRVFGRIAGPDTSDMIGYLPEERGLYRKMKIRDLLRFYGELKQGKDVKKEVDHWLERFDLADRAGKRVETLSKGLSQKVQFIAAIVARPGLIILDEPFSGLDPVNADALRDAVLDLREEGATILFSTHDMNTAESLCDFIFMIFRGKKVLDGTLSAIQDGYGRDTVRVRLEEDATPLPEMSFVENVSDYGKWRELHLAEGTDTQAVLEHISGRTRIRSFEVSKPSLHEIFVKIAGPGAREAADA